VTREPQPESYKSRKVKSDTVPTRLFAPTEECRREQPARVVTYSYSYTL